MSASQKACRAAGIAFFVGNAVFAPGGSALARPPAQKVPPALQVQVADSAALAPQPAAPIAAATAILPPASGLAPAPVPNQDLDDPTLNSVSAARLSPALLSRNDVFEGDGYAWGSNNDHGIDQKTPPAPGLNLSVPVK